MMNYSCVAGCIDAELPIRISLFKLYQWPDADAEFLRLLIHKESCNSHDTTTNVRRRRYDSRQKYLRSYTFSRRKETFGERTKRWLQRGRGEEEEEGRRRKKGRNKEEGYSAMGISDAVNALFKCLLSCMVRVDVLQETKPWN